MALLNNLVVTFGVGAAGIIGFEMAAQGDLGAGLQAEAKKLDGWVTKMFGGGSGTGTTKGCPTGQVSVPCAKSTTCMTWDQIDAALGPKGANYPGKLDHSQTELNAYIHACGGTPAGST